jgi:hypothetical protein
MKKSIVMWMIGLLVLSSVAVGVAIAASDTSTDAEVVETPQVTLVDSAVVDGAGGAGGAAGGAGGGATGGGGADVNVAQY